MTQQDYNPLLEKIRLRMSSWKGRFLSFGGRLQLVKSVINSLINFWIGVFRLPKACIVEVEKLCAAFLWSGPELNPRKAKVAWKDVSKPKDEGCLGLKSLEEANKVCILKLIWRLNTTQSLWVLWIQENNLRKRSYWAVNEHMNAGSWIWKKMLKYRPVAKQFYKISVGKGDNTSFWFDNWCEMGTLYDLLGARGCIDMGISLEATVKEVLRKPKSRSHRYPALMQIDEIISKLRDDGTRRNQEDTPIWRYKGDKFKPKFSTNSTWDLIRTVAPKCDWYKGVWFSKATPKFTFLTWLAIKDRLATGDRILKWSATANTTCVLCSHTLETRAHLYFDCSYTQQIWSSLMKEVLGAKFTASWTEVVTLLTCAEMDHTSLFILRYAFQVCIHTIWRERNNRRHGEIGITAIRLSKMIDKMIRNKLSILKEMGDKRYANTLLFWFSTRASSTS